MKTANKIAKQLKFWNREEVDQPLIGYSIGNYFPSSRYPTATSLFKENEWITPEILNPQDFIEDYERLYQLSLSVDQDLIWVAEPLLGIPWLEGMLGSRIRATGNSLWADPWVEDWTLLPAQIDLENSVWFRKYIEFTEALIKHSRGRFYVGQSVLRGPSDVLFSLRGHSRAILDFFEYPGEVKRGLKLISDDIPRSGFSPTENCSEVRRGIWSWVFLSLGTTSLRLVTGRCVCNVVSYLLSRIFIPDRRGNLTTLRIFSFSSSPCFFFYLRPIDRK